MEEKKNKRIGAYKVLSDETLKSETKADLIERIRILEHNWACTEESYNNSVKNSEKIFYEQKAEIERLTEERKTANIHDLMYWFNAYNECVEDCDKYVIEASANKAECMRLQKQVDELKEERENMEREIFALHEDFRKSKQDMMVWHGNEMKQAVKDTAKEILTEIGKEPCEHAYLNWDCEWYKRACEKYGVEVE